MARNEMEQEEAECRSGGRCAGRLADVTSACGILPYQVRSAYGFDQGRWANRQQNETTVLISERANWEPLGRTRGIRPGVMAHGRFA